MLTFEKYNSSQSPTRLVARRRHTSKPSTLFSVDIRDAVFSTLPIPMSSVHIHPSQCTPEIQQFTKSVKFTSFNNSLVRRSNRCFIIQNRFLRILLFPLLLLQRTSSVHSLPGTNYCFVNSSSHTSAEQQKYVDHIITNMASDHHIPESSALSLSSTSEYSPSHTVHHSHDILPTEPYCFIADTDSVSFVVDSGANRIIVNDASLLSHLTITNAKIKGIEGSPVQIKGVGKLSISLKSDSGKFSTVKNLDAVLVPSSPYNLIPPQLLVTQMKARGFSINYFHHSDKTYVFSYTPSHMHLQAQTLTIPINNNDLFEFRTNEGYSSFMHQAGKLQPSFNSFAGNGYVSPLHHEQREYISPFPSNKRKHSLTSIPSQPLDSFPLKSSPFSTSFETSSTSPIPDAPAVEIYKKKQFRLLTLHEQLGHVSFSILRLLSKCGIIPSDLSTIDPPTCPGCAYGKAHRRQTRHKGTPNFASILPATAPGQVVSVDQLISPTPGFVPCQRGIPTTKRYLGATVFVDHFSNFTYVHLMTEMDAAETVRAKESFERLTSSYDVTVRHYHCDNGLFNSHLFHTSIRRSNQTISFCGVNAHHQNGKAERRIRDITEGARTALLHASHRWPKAIDASLWPAALKNYVNIRNNLPTEYIPGAKIGRKTSSNKFVGSPLSKLSGVENSPNLKHFHPFGSPVYVLNSKLQAGQSHHKWTDRSRVGIFLSHSPSHTSSVPLILNTTTACVSPQFHCLYDDDFATCKTDIKFRSFWQYKAKLRDANPSLIDLITDPHDFSLPLPCQFDPPPVTHIPPIFQQEFSSPSSNPPSTPLATPMLPDPSPPQPILEPTILPVKTTRSGRNVVKAARFDETPLSSLMAYLSTFSPSSHDSDADLLQPCIKSHEPHPFALLGEHIFSFLVTDPDTMTLKEALEQDDRSHFLAAMKKELKDHISRKHWKEVPRRSVPSHKTCISMVWSMKRKRDPVGNIVKWKARLCAGGHRSIEFVDYWNTYSPVVSWQTIRLIFTLAIINNWHIHSIDFVMAFPQADIKTDIFMRPPTVPPDFIIPDLPSFVDRISNVYKLVKNLYGLKDAGRTWNDHLTSGLLKRGWKQSSLDNCLFTKKGLIFILYVDDACIISHSKHAITNEISSLQRDFDLTNDGELQDYLGTRFDRSPDGSVTLTQPRMVDRVLEIVGLLSGSNVKLHDTPATAILNSTSSPRLQKWNYRSAVGCLSYHNAMVRPDITFAVQQFARFCNNPGQEHEEAVKRICRYLMKTRSQGLVLKPDKTKGLECYVDADYAGSWTKLSSHDPLSTHSRTGFYITYAGCPILWKSKVQSLIALSTTEAEYIALSTALREVIAIIRLLEDLKSQGFPIHGSTPVIKCKTFEDNMSCISLAISHKTRPRTKHLCIKLHHFRSYVVNKIISIEYASTKDQIADIFTKPLARPQFSKLRDLLMSWN